MRKSWVVGTLILVFLALAIWFSASKSRTNLNRKTIPSTEPRPGLCRVSFDSKKYELTGDEVQAPWQLYLEIRNSPLLVRIDRGEHKIAPDNLIYFYAAIDPHDKLKSKFRLEHYELDSIVVFEGDDNEYRIPPQMQESLLTYFGSLEN